MDPLNVLLLIGAGLVGGFVAGLIGVGGGIIFAPVLFFYYSAIGTDPALVPPLTLGSSLFCTLLAAGSGTLSQWKTGDVRARTVGIVGAFAAAAVTGVTLFVTTQPWYSAGVFQVVLAAILLVAVWRMVGGERPKKRPGWRDRLRTGVPLLAATGAAAGAVASAAGVGGGVVLVPAYNQLLRLPLRIATATSLATIVIISAAGVLTYALTGLGSATPGTAVGYVDVGRVVWLGGPAVVAARWGVGAAQRVNVRVIRWAFAVLAVLVALRLLGRAVGLL